MSRKRKQSNPLTSLISLFAYIVESLIIIIFHLTIFLYDLLTFIKSKYMQKSGIGFFKMYFSKGYYGEFVLYRKVIRIFGNEAVLTNIYLENKNTETTEIDVLAISTKGIYVFEMKNYAGYIFGSEKDQQWTQVLNKWTKNKFYNPLRQNYAHTKAVESYLEVSNNVIVPLVVFSNRSKLSKIDIDKSQNVFQYKNAIRFVKKYEKNQKNVFTDQQIEDTIKKLIKKTNMSEEVQQKHISDVIELQKRAK